jgi:hypothetical protein
VVEIENLSESARACWERSCAGKEKFPSMNAAEAFAKAMHEGKLQLRKDVPRGDWGLLNAYGPCEFCSTPEKPQFHLGHAK